MQIIANTQYHATEINIVGQEIGNIKNQY